MTPNIPQTSPDTGEVFERLQEALEALGALEKAVGDTQSDDLRKAVRENLRASIRALQNARDTITEMYPAGG